MIKITTYLTSEKNLSIFWGFGISVFDTEKKTKISSATSNNSIFGHPMALHFYCIAQQCLDGWIIISKIQKWLRQQQQMLKQIRRRNKNTEKFISLKISFASWKVFLGQIPCRDRIWDIFWISRCPKWEWAPDGPRILIGRDVFEGGKENLHLLLCFL